MKKICSILLALILAIMPLTLCAAKALRKSPSTTTAGLTSRAI